MNKTYYFMPVIKTDVGWIVATEVYSDEIDMDGVTESHMIQLYDAHVQAIHAALADHGWTFRPEWQFDSKGDIEVGIYSDARLFFCQDADQLSFIEKWLETHTELPTADNEPREVA